jgi:hypothetical protein
MKASWGFSRERIVGVIAFALRVGPAAVMRPRGDVTFQHIRRNGVELHGIGSRVPEPVEQRTGRCEAAGVRSGIALISRRREMDPYFGERNFPRRLRIQRRVAKAAANLTVGEPAGHLYGICGNHVAIRIECVGKSRESIGEVCGVAPGRKAPFPRRSVRDSAM